VGVSAALLLLNTELAYSALLGGLIAVIPNIYFASLAFRFSGARAASNVTRSVYRGELRKFVLTAVLFASVFALVKPLSAGTLFAVFILMMALNWILSLRLLRSWQFNKR
jgi:ATP synthase protein I